MRAALVLLVLALPLAACGGVSLDPVAKAADKSAASGSEHVTFTGTVITSGQTVSMAGSGDFKNDPKLGKAHFSMTVGGKQISMDEVMQGWTVYMRSPLFASALPAEKHWLSVDVQKAGQSLGVNVNQFAQQSPADALQALKKAGSVTKVGTAVVDGVSTTHYRAKVDFSKVAKLGVKGAPVDVWIGDDGLLRRMTMDYSTTAAGNQSRTKMQMDFADYGEQVHVQVPRAGVTVDMTKVGGNP